MSVVLSIATDEWRLWRRSRLAVVATGLFTVVLALACLLTVLDMRHAAHERTEQQATAEETFLSQPERHPHRMVHYGHYAFRAPPALAIVDPGVDAVTGQAIFLEGHRQNSAMFAEAKAQASLGGLGDLTPARVYQILLPLLLIAIGHAMIVREREARTLGPLLAQGVGGRQLFLGKGTALAGMAAVLLMPLLGLCAYGLVQGEAASAGLGLFGLYAVYALVWCSLVMLVTSVAKTRSVALGVLIVLWLVTALIVPRLAVATAASALPSEGKIATDLRMQADLRQVGDGHNAADPAFEQLRANLLAEYGVDRVEDLPVNFRGIVAGSAEAELTDLLNRYAEERMSLERGQSEAASGFGWLSPVMAVSGASRALAGTDLATHHRFLRETEALRFDFVQDLNRVHAEQLAYSDDINRSRDPEAEKRTRVSAENWAVLEAFRFEPDAASVRVDRAMSGVVPLLAWLAVFSGLGFFAAGRLKP